MHEAVVSWLKIHVRDTGASRDTDAPIIKANEECAFPWLSGPHQVTFLVQQRGHGEPWRRRWTTAYRKQARVQKVASSSPKTSWENVVMGLKTRAELDSSPEQLILWNISAASNQLPEVTGGRFHAWSS